MMTNKEANQHHSNRMNLNRNDNGNPSRSVTFDRVRVASESPLASRSPSNRFKTLTVGVLVLAILASCTVLYLASRLLVPIVIACLAYLTLRPFVCKLCKRGLSQVVASSVVILVLFTVMGGILAALHQPSQHWLKAAPESMARVRENMDAWRAPLTAVDDAEQKFDNASEAASGIPRAVEVSVQKPAIISETVLINKTGQVLAFFAAIGILTFFLLSTGDDLINRILHVLPNDEKRHTVLEMIGGIQDSVGRYFGQITMINFGLGIVVTGVMWLVGMPTPVLWGVLAMLFNFIPYVGALMASALVFMAALSTFESITRAALTTGAFWLCTALEGQLVTPTILGKTLKVGPVVVLVAVAVWGFLWGLPGVFIAVPLLIVQREVFAKFNATRPIAVVLGEELQRPVDTDEQLKDDKSIQAAAV